MTLALAATPIPLPPRDWQDTYESTREPQTDNRRVGWPNTILQDDETNDLSEMRE